MSMVFPGPGRSSRSVPEGHSNRRGKRRPLIGHIAFVIGLAVASAGARGACPFETTHFRVGADVTYCSYNDIQSAINAVGTCPVIIDITREHVYTNQHLTINAKNVTLQGYGDGVSCYNLTQCIPGPNCPAPSATTPLVTLDGGNSGGRVLSITGASNVNIRNLTITHGAVSSGADGGGIDFTGAGNLNITRSTVATNYAGYGGGISVTASGGSLNLRLQADTLIQNNTAEHSGGGIRVEGSSRLYALYDRTLITFNHALDGYGGGIEILGPARADLGSPGYNGAGVVSNNDGVHGAGIAVLDNGNGEAVLRTFADAAARPTSIDDNGGALEGGGIYLAGRADACLLASRLDGNIGEDGAAIFRDCRGTSSDTCYYDSGIYINDGWPARLGSECGPETVASLTGSTACKPYDEQCSVLVGNMTQHTDGSPSAGAVVYSIGELFAKRFRMRDNVANQAVRAYGQATLERCLIADNSFSGPLMESAASPSRVHACTITHNVIDGGFVFEWSFVNDVDLAYDIIDQPGRYTVNWLNYYGNGAFDVSYMLTNNSDGLPQNNPSIVEGSPVFVDAANGDYHLKPVLQTALDFGTTYQGTDLDRVSAVTDLPGITNFLGAVDLGAYERQNLFDNCGNGYSIFCNGFNR